MGVERPGERDGDPNGLIVRRGSTSLEAHGRSVIIILCAFAAAAAVIGSGWYRDQQRDRSLAVRDEFTQRSLDAQWQALADIERKREQDETHRQFDHQKIMRRLDIVSCEALMTVEERRWARQSRSVTWDDRCPWITPEPK